MRKKEKKILILNWRCPSNPKSGGAEKVTMKHASYWSKNGMKVFWLAGGFSIDGEKAGRFEVMDGVYIFRYGNPYTIYLLAPFLYWFKWHGKFDVVVDEIHGIPFFTPFWAWKSKKIAYIHEVAGEIWDEMFRPPLNWVGKIVERFYLVVYRNMRFWTVSNSTKQNLIKNKVQSNNIDVIPNGIDIKPFELKKENVLTLISVSRIVPMKRIDKVIDLFSSIKKKEKDAQLWIVGSGDKAYITKLKNRVEKLGIKNSVKWFGFVTDSKKKELLARSHFLINMSIKEGFGLVVLEANVQGTPAIGMNVSGLKDIIKDNVNGFLIYDTNGAVENLITLYRNKERYSKLSKTSKKYVVVYDWRNILNRSFNLISSL